MTAITIDGKAVAARVRAQLKQDVDQFAQETNTRPGLATILVGSDPASEVYVANKRRQASEAGIADFHEHLPEDATYEHVASTISRLADDPAVSGILLQLPLPGRLESARLIDLIPATKDVDGLTTASAGLLSRGKPGLRPCTPSGVIELLDAYDVPIEGAIAVVVGRSELVGTPLAQMLIQRNATVTVAHSRTVDLAAATVVADIVIAAAGVPGLITAEHIREGSAVVDVGIHRTPHGLRGDVDFERVSAKARWVTPVPGGVGPMTIAMLLRNTLIAARLQRATTTE